MKVKDLRALLHGLDDETALEMRIETQGFSIRSGEIRDWLRRRETDQQLSLVMQSHPDNIDLHIDASFLEDGVLVDPELDLHFRMRNEEGYGNACT
jgi:hypothetical protein